MSHKIPAYKKLGTFLLAVIIFFTVSGGPYGLEPLLYYCSATQSLALLVAIPIIWVTPILLIVLELNGQMPITGGYYYWVKHALGLRWALYQGWWAWLWLFVDLAIYPQLIILYASLFFPEIAAYKIPIGLCLIWGCAMLNILGAVPVGETAIFLGVLVLIPFGWLFYEGIAHNSIALHWDMITSHVNSSNLGLAIFTVIWNFNGWDNVTTYADEVDKPAKAYLRALIYAFVVIFLLYFITMLVTVTSGISPAVLKDQGYPVLGAVMGGKWLSIALAVGGIISSIGIFLAVLLSVSRIPEVMAKDKFLPASLKKLHPKYGTPYMSILACAAVVSCMMVWTFGELITIEITLYFAILVQEYISLVVMRIKEPGRERKFKIPLNVFGLHIMFALPLLTFVYAIVDILTHTQDSYKSFLFAIGMVLSADVVWRIIKVKDKYWGA